ncbi:MAG TPA: hypothetical protein VGE29_13840 [Prosthecobacter sp.]
MHPYPVSRCGLFCSSGLQHFERQSVTGSILTIRLASNWGGTQDTSSFAGGAGGQAEDYIPSGKGNNKATRDQDTCEVWIEESVRYDVSPQTTIDRDIAGFATANGEAAIVAHEQRRVTVYEKAYGAYLKGFENLAGRCRKKFQKPQDCQKYEKKLSKWLTDLHTNAKQQYEKYVSLQQRAITNENRAANLLWGYDSNRADGLLFDGFKDPYKVKQPDNPTQFKCPEL